MTTNRRARGAVLVMALLLTLFVSVVGLYLVNGVTGTYSAAQHTAKAAQARCFAIAGLEDLTIKLAKDPFFPMGVPDAYQEFSYQEWMRSLSGGDTIGLYTVTLDWREKKDGYLKLLSVGTLGTVRKPRARYIVTCRLRLSDFSRTDWTEGEI